MLRVLDESPNPVLGALVRDLRDRERQRDRHRFRGLVSLLGTLLAHEIGKTLEGRVETVDTPLGRRELLVPASPPVLATALRAGLPFLDGFLEVFRDAEVGFFGAARREGEAAESEGLSLPIDLSYEAAPPTRGRTLIFADPMVATGSTLIAISRRLSALDEAPARFVVAGLVGFRGAEARLTDSIPNCELWLVTCDDELDERGFIVPGLGDAGDLCFGAKRSRPPGERDSS